MAALLRATSLAQCGPRDLALLYVAHVAFQLGEFSFSSSVQRLSSIVDAAPGDALRLLKSEIQNTQHRTVVLGEEEQALISETVPRERFPMSISVLPGAQFGTREANVSAAPVILPARLLNDIRTGMEDAATWQIAAQVIESAFDIEGLDDWSELPLGTIAIIAQQAWRASQMGEVSERNYSEAVSKLLRVSSAQVLKASLAFSLPGIGPAISAALFASRIERHRPAKKMP